MSTKYVYAFKFENVNNAIQNFFISDYELY